MFKNLTGKTTLLLPTNVTPVNPDWDQIAFLSATCCYANPINAKKRTQIATLTAKLSKEELEVAFNEITQTHQRLLKKLAFVLNHAHGTKFSGRFWGIQLGLPFLYFIATVYERRYRLLQVAKYFGKQSWKLAIPRDLELLFLTPENFTQRTNNHISTENWVLYADIALAENLPTTNIEITPAIKLIQTEIFLAKIKGTFSEKIKNKLKQILLNGAIVVNKAKNFSSKNLKSQIFIPSNWAYVSFLTWSKFKLNIIPSINLDLLKFEKNNKLRSKLNDIFAESDFEKTIIKLLPKYMPLSFLEGFRLIQKKAEPYIAPGHYLTPNLFGNIIFNYAAASAADQFDANLITSQHGGGEGQHQNFFSEYFSRRYSDYYFTFGWQDSHYKGATVVPFSSVELSRMVKRSQKKVSNSHGLFISTSGIPHIFRGDHWASMEGFEVYFDDQLIFLENLDEHIRNFITYRPFPYNNMGWNSILDRLKERFPEVSVLNDVDIYSALIDAKIIIIDHNITTLLQAMTLNKPIICYWQPFLFPLRPECMKDFEQLKKAGILYHSPVSAAQHLSSIWNTTNKWWQSDTVQNVRKSFVNKYARTSDDIAGEWRTMLQEITLEKKGNQ